MVVLNISIESTNVSEVNENLKRVLWVLAGEQGRIPILFL